MSDSDIDAADDRADTVDAVEGDTSSFVTLVTHFYRAEMDRITTWRNRLDQTTNWAVVVMAAILTWAFSSRNNPHYVLLLGAVTVGVFLFIEAQRFQEYDAFRERMRTLQNNFFAEGLAETGRADKRWRERLSGELEDPSIELSLTAALAHRLLHVYLPLQTVLIAAWALRISVFESGESWRQTASIAAIPGAVVVGVVGAVYLVLVGLTAWSLRRSFRREFEYEVELRGE